MTPLRTDGRVPLYRRVLGEAWDSLPAPLQTMHDVQSERTAGGVAVVERGSGLLARLVAFVIGLPPAGTDIPITVSFRTRQALARNDRMRHNRPQKTHPHQCDQGGNTCAASCSG